MAINYDVEYPKLQRKVNELSEELFNTTADLETAQAQLEAVRGLPVHKIFEAQFSDEGEFVDYVLRYDLLKALEQKESE